MSTAPQATDLTPATATVGNAEIVRFVTDPWDIDIVVILGDNGKTYRLDKRAVNTRYPKAGQRGCLEYRSYEFGSRWFFDTAIQERETQIVLG